VRVPLPILVVGIVVAGCGSGSGTIAETGVDGLVVPTPSPDPADFVDVVDNPWFVLDDALFADGRGRPVERVVLDGPDVAGVPTTAVTLGPATDYFAQDADGNVWWFGRDGEWLAGRGGAEAGLVMPAEPRRGDGYRRAGVPGADLRAVVVSADDDSVLLEVADHLERQRQLFTRGVGLELVETTTGAVVLARDVEGE